MKPRDDGEGVARHQPPGNFLEPNIERDKVEEIRGRANAAIKAAFVPLGVKELVLDLLSRLTVSEKRAEEIERELEECRRSYVESVATAERERDEARAANTTIAIEAVSAAACAHSTMTLLAKAESERDEARSSLMRVEASLGQISERARDGKFWDDGYLTQSSRHVIGNLSRSALSPHPERENEEGSGSRKIHGGV